ncbi:MAG: ABC transporter ATP-binding protein [Bryobacterales bacterium]|nr:ABC transporter ATP-binding protein [Bryobacterales bacterium]
MSVSIASQVKPLELLDVSLSFGVVEVLRDISLAIAHREFVAVVGPSGCGKSTLLKVLSGDEAPSTGTVTRQGQVRTVYQQDGLFPWRTVTENISLGLRFVTDDQERQRQLAELLDLIRLHGFENHYPHQLSGGMRQRVELARALAGDSDILLMDEPFSALDYLTRLRMRGELVRLLEERPRTVVLVTHDIEEASQLADRVLVLTDRPARIRREITIASPRPRDLIENAVVEAARRILAEVDIESPR